VPDGDRRPQRRQHRREFVALQRHLWNRSDADTDATASITTRFHQQFCAPENEVTFYVGNQAKRPQTFSILGGVLPQEGLLAGQRGIGHSARLDHLVDDHLPVTHLGVRLETQDRHHMIGRQLSKLVQLRLRLRRLEGLPKHPTPLLDPARPERLPVLLAFPRLSRCR
jgi:hypothetical protein